MAMTEQITSKREEVLASLLVEFVKLFRIRKSDDLCRICHCRYKHSEDCLVRRAEKDV